MQSSGDRRALRSATSIIAQRNHGFAPTAPELLWAEARVGGGAVVRGEAARRLDRREHAVGERAPRRLVVDCRRGDVKAVVQSGPFLVVVDRIRLDQEAADRVVRVGNLV